MNKLLKPVNALVIFAASVLTTNLASAQTIWTNGSGNWSAAANWSPNAVPNSTTAVQFTTNAAAPGVPGTVDNTVDASVSIASLQFANTNNTGTGVGFYHTTQINAGQTLTVLGNLTAGITPDIANCTVSAAVTGAGTLFLSNSTAGLNVSQGDTGNAAQAILNMTNLNTFIATNGGITVGTFNTPNPSVARQKGFLYLAKTNIINCVGNAPRGFGSEGQIEVGEANGNGSSVQIPMYLGMMNTIYVDSMVIGADKQGSGALLAFNPVFTNTAPLAYIRGTSGNSSRVSKWKVGDNENQPSTGTSCSGTVDLSNGSLDAMVDVMTIGQGDTGTGTAGGDTSQGTFTFNSGTNNVNTLFLGYRGNCGVGTSHPSGTMNVNGTATLIANNAICLSFNGGGAGGYALGTLNINGGTVLANSITNGVLAAANTTATINMTGGTLGITSLLGSIGTATAPLATLSLSGATLQLPISGLQTNIVVNNLTLNGTTNIINITSLPATVITYNTQIPLIAYSGSINGAGFNIGVSNLPGTYQGYISNNTANLSIDLVLTSGPTNISTLEWKGTASGNWDTTSGNWLNGVSTVAYADGTGALFDDHASGTTTVNLTATRMPASITVSNNTLPYAFSGSGIGGSTGLTKYGNGALLFTNSGNAFAGPVAINAGTVQFGNGGTSGNLPGNPGNTVLDNGNLVFNRSGNVQLPNTISGSGTLTENGTSVLTVTAANSFSGTAVVKAGTLVLNGMLSGALTNAPGSVVGGSGINAGTVDVAGLVQPSASTGTPATFTSGGTMTLYPSATAAFDLSGTDTTPGSGINDLLSVGGDLDLNNNVIALNFLGVPQTGVPYTLVNFNGTQNGVFSSTIAGTHFTGTLSQGSSPVTVTLSGSGANLKWDATANNLWNVGTDANWLNLVSTLQDVFYQGDTVVFDDSVAGVTNNISIPTGVSVSPTVLSNNSSTVNYTISGPGQIAGNVSIIKQGASTLTLNGANINYVGNTTVAGGTLRVGNNAAFGTGETPGTVTVTNGGTIELNGAGLGEVPVIAAGTGVGGNGAIINSGADQIHAVNIVKLSDNATFGGSGRWDIRVNGLDTAQLTTTDGNTHNIVKTGSNLVALVTCTIDPSIGDIDIQGGAFSLQLAGTAQNSGGWFGDTTHTISVENGGQLGFNTLGSAFPLYRTIALNNGSTLSSSAGDNAVGGSVVLTGNATVSVTGGTTPWLLVSGIISGSGNLIVNGSLPLECSGDNIYTGNTLINAGALNLVGDGSISNSADIIIAAGTRLDVSARSDATFTLNSGQTLQGNGSVNGNLLIGAGATLSPGTNAASIGALTVSNNVTLGGTNVMKINAVTGAADQIVNTNGGGSITYGGTLVVKNLSGTITNGQTFQLFVAGSYVASSFSTLTLPAATGLTWTNNLAIDGTLTAGVVSGPAAQPAITSISLTGTSLVINGTNGLAGEQYNVLSTTNLTLPLSSWTVLPTNIFSAGAFSLTNTVNPTAPQSYYILRVP